MIKCFIFTIVCSLALCLNSCNVTCEYTCEGIGDTETGSSKVSKSKCDDCDFVAVNVWDNSGWDCTCSEE